MRIKVVAVAEDGTTTRLWAPVRARQADSHVIDLQKYVWSLLCGDEEMCSVPDLPPCRVVMDGFDLLPTQCCSAILRDGDEIQMLFSAPLSPLTPQYTRTTETVKSTSVPICPFPTRPSLPSLTSSVAASITIPSIPTNSSAVPDVGLLWKQLTPSISKGSEIDESQPTRKRRKRSRKQDQTSTDTIMQITISNSQNPDVLPETEMQSVNSAVEMVETACGYFVEDTSILCGDWKHVDDLTLINPGDSVRLRSIVLDSSNTPALGTPIMGVVTEMSESHMTIRLHRSAHIESFEIPCLKEMQIEVLQQVAIAEAVSITEDSSPVSLDDDLLSLFAVRRAELAL